MVAQGKKEYGMVGCSQMGENLARQALGKGIRVVKCAHKKAPSDLLVGKGQYSNKNHRDDKAIFSPTWNRCPSFTG